MQTIIPAEQHNKEIAKNQESWRQKVLIQRIYQGFYQEIAKFFRNDLSGNILELGSGMGNIKQVIPNCITSDIFPNPWLDRQENAYALTFSGQSISNLILFDVWHHLEYPKLALQEFSRVIVPGGRLVLFEPAWAGSAKSFTGVFTMSHSDGATDFPPPPIVLFRRKPHILRLNLQQPVFSYAMTEWIFTTTGL